MKRFMPKVRIEVNAGEGDEPMYEYWEGAMTHQSIDVYSMLSGDLSVNLLTN